MFRVLCVLALVLMASIAQAEVCQDKISNCTNYTKSVSCQAPYLHWGLEFCKKWCGLCDYKNPSNASGSCRDSIPDCVDYLYNNGREKLCKGSLKGWATGKCDYTCGFCS